jgi:hypothetical protein
VFDKVTITYRGAKYEVGRGRDFYGIWTVGGSRSQPLQWWPETSEGWSAAWTKFTQIEAPGAITPVGRRTPPVASGPVTSSPVASSRAQAGESAGVRDPGTAAAGPATALLDDRDRDRDREGAAGSGDAPFTQGPQFTQGSPFSQGPEFAQGPQFARGGAPYGARTADSRTGAVGAALLAVGVVLGIAGLFPAYLAGASLSQQPAQLVPHAIYLAVWAASAVLILLGGVRLRLGALLGVGISVVTFGLFFADAGTAIAAGAHTAGWGLWLSLLGWLACAAGSVLAFLLRPAAASPADGARGRLARQDYLRRPRGSELGPVVLLVLAGLGVAAAFAPAWDSYTLRTAAGQSQSLTAGNAFSNPGLVITGDVAVMVALAAVVIVAALWRPLHHGALLLAGAVIPMAAQAVSALIQAGEATSPTQFGISPAQATQIGLTINSGVTPAFWIYCAFLVALVVSCAWMLFTPHQGTGTPAESFAPPSGPAAGSYAYPWSPAAPAAEQSSVRPTAADDDPADLGDDDDLADLGDDDDRADLDGDDETGTDMVPGFETTGYRGSGDHPTA